MEEEVGVAAYSEICLPGLALEAVAEYLVVSAGLVWAVVAVLVSVVCFRVIHIHYPQDNGYGYGLELYIICIIYNIQ